MVAIQIQPKSNSYKLTSGWYTGNVEVTIMSIATEPQNIKYTLEIENNVYQPADDIGDYGPIIFDITDEGITTITAWTVDDAGNDTPKKTVQVKIDKNDPERPEVHLLKDGVVDITTDSDRWIGKDGEIVAQCGDERENRGLKVAKIEYEITRGESVKTDSQNGKIISVESKELGEDGAYVVKFWAVDQAGRKSTQYTEVSFSKDTIAPTNVRFVSTSAMSQRITANVAGKDTNGSGIQEYIFKIKESTAGSYTTANTITVNNVETCKYVYTGLTVGGQYDLLIEVRDKAGNSATATTEGYVSTKEWKVNIGDYVEYEPDKNKTFSMNSTETTTNLKYAALSGYASNTDSYTADKFDWRIWDLNEEEDKLVLIADGVTSKTFYLQGAQGYNNAVKLLDDLCNTVYSNSSLGAEGRSLGFDDITAKMTSQPSFTKTVNAYTSSNYYPIIHMFEEYSKVDGLAIPKGGEYAAGPKALTLDQQKQYYKPTDYNATDGYLIAKASIQPTETYLSQSLTSGYKNSMYANLVTKVGNSSTSLEDYWLASRCIRILDGSCWFCVRFVYHRNVRTCIMFDSLGASGYEYPSVRPVVEIPLSSINIKTQGLAGSSTIPWVIEKL